MTSPTFQCPIQMQPKLAVMAPGIFSHLHVLSNLPTSKAMTEALAGFADPVVLMIAMGYGISIYCTGPLYAAAKGVKDYLLELKNIG